MRGISLEELREIFRDQRLHVECGLITSLEVAQDRSKLRVGVNIVPEGNPVEAEMSWDLVGPDFGIFQFPSLNDLVLVAFCGGSEDEAIVIRRLTSKEDKIPVRAVDGHLVMAARPGTHTDVNSDTKINLTRQGEGDEQLVLGNTFKAAYSSHLGEHVLHADHSAKHKHIGNLGYYTAVPDLAAQFNLVKQNVQDIKDSPVDDELILSDLSYTEK